MTREELQHRCNVLAAFLRGERVEWWRQEAEKWVQETEVDVLRGCILSSHVEWRIAPKPKLRPWTAETVPFPLAVRHKNWSRNHHAFCPVVGVAENGVFILDMATATREPRGIGWEDLLYNWEQRDGSPCGEVVG